MLITRQPSPPPVVRACPWIRANSVNACSACSRLECRPRKKRRPSREGPRRG